MALRETTEPALTREDLETYWTRGFVGPFTALPPDEMVAIRRTLCERVLPTPSSHSPYPTRLRHLDSSTVFRLCSAPALVRRVASLYGPDLMLWGSALFDKPPARPDRPEEFPWHQDTYNWRLEPMLTVSGWLAITPATLENGCMEVIPGSHKQAVPVQHTSDPRYSFLFAGRRADPGGFDESKKVALVLEPGQFVLFNERLLHHSNPNRTRERRLGLSIRVTVPFVKVDEPFPCVVLHGEDRFGFNRTVTPPAQEPDEVGWFRSPPSADAFTFDQAVVGLGWHFAEYDGERWFCWSGPEKESWLDLRVRERGDHRLRCDIAHVLDANAVEDLQVRVNDQPVAVRVRAAGQGLELEGHVPARTLASGEGRVRVSFRVRKTLRPCDLSGSSLDTRPLGIAVSRVSLTRLEP